MILLGNAKNNKQNASNYPEHNLTGGIPCKLTPAKGDGHDKSTYAPDQEDVAKPVDVLSQPLAQRDSHLESHAG